MPFPHPYRHELINFLQTLRIDIINAFEALESSHHKFEKKAWDYQAEGGGEMAILRGELFEKAAVNWSGVGGPALPMAPQEGPFFATGVSLITHMANPHVPTVHMNLRFIETPERYWFGGGYDLTPMGFPYAEDTNHFHQVAQETVEAHQQGLYEEFSQQAREYFYIPHRKRERGVGGLFFDYYNTENFEADRQLWQSIGNSFLKAILPIYERRIPQTYTPQERHTQLINRAFYAEFNLMYDRGTKFGFQSGGNPDAILCSMPPLVHW